MNIRAKGLAWLEKMGRDSSEDVRISKFYQPNESRTGHPAWWFEFLENVADASPFEPINLLCQTSPTATDFHHLRIPKGLFPACRHHLGRRHGKSSLFLSAEDELMFREVRGDGRIEFADFQTCKKGFLSEPMSVR